MTKRIWRVPGSTCAARLAGSRMVDFTAAPAATAPAPMRTKSRRVIENRFTTGSPVLRLRRPFSLAEVGCVKKRRVCAWRLRRLGYGAGVGMTILTGCSGRGVSRVIAAIGLGLMAGLVLSANTARAASRESVPDFGPNVMVFNPTMPMAAIQQQIDKVYAVQQH